MDCAAGRGGAARPRRGSLWPRPPPIAVLAARAIANRSAPGRRARRAAAPGVFACLALIGVRLLRPGPRAGAGVRCCRGMPGGSGRPRPASGTNTANRRVHRSREMACIGKRDAIRRRSSRVPGDRSATPGVDGTMPGPLGRIADQHAMARHPGGARTRVLCAAAADRRRDSARRCCSLICCCRFRSSTCMSLSPATLISSSLGHMAWRRWRCGGGLAPATAPMRSSRCFARWPASRSRRKA